MTRYNKPKIDINPISEEEKRVDAYSAYSKLRNIREENIDDIYIICFKSWLMENSDEVWKNDILMSESDIESFFDDDLSVEDFHDIKTSDESEGVTITEIDFITSELQKIDIFLNTRNPISEDAIKTKKFMIYKRKLEDKKQKISQIITEIDNKAKLFIIKTLDDYGKDYFFFSQEDKDYFINILFSFFNNQTINNSPSIIITKKNVKSNLFKALKSIYNYCSTNEKLPKDDSFFNAIKFLSCLKDINYETFNSNLRRS